MTGAAGAIVDLSATTDAGFLGPLPTTPGIYSGAQKLVVARYNFATDPAAGVTGTSTCFGATKIPAHFLIRQAWANVITAITGSGVSVAVQVEGANDIITAAAITGAPWSTTGRKIGIPVSQTASTWVLTTVARDVSVVISGGTVTAALFDVYLLGEVIAIA